MREAVNLYCELSGQPRCGHAGSGEKPGCSGPDSAERCIRESAGCFAEGIELLTPAFLRYPAGLASLMGRLAQEYLATVEQMNEIPDVALLAPVAEAFARLQANEEV